MLKVQNTKKREEQVEVSDRLSRPRLKVGFLLAPRFTLTAFSGFIDVLRLAADERDRSRQIDCTWEVLGLPNSDLISSSGVHISPTEPMENPSNYDYIVVVGGLLYGGQEVLPGTYSFLKTAAQQNVPLVGLCTGTFMIARSGLMNGYEACVSWLHREEFANEFPDINVQSDRMLIIDRDRLTCAGGTSVVHLAAHIVEKHCSRSQALKSLRILIEDSPLPLNAWQPEQVVSTAAKDPLVRKAMLIMEQDLSATHALPDFCKELGVSVRQLERRFFADVKLTPTQYKTELRLQRAKWMIQNTTKTMTDIAYSTGFSDSSYFSRSFKSRFKKTPSSLR